MEEGQEQIAFMGQPFECVEEFCNLRDMISEGSGGGASCVARVRSGWKNFWELLPILMLKGTFPLN